MRILPRAGKRPRLGRAPATGILALNGRNNELKKRTCSQPLESCSALPAMLMKFVSLVKFGVKADPSLRHIAADMAWRLQPCTAGTLPLHELHARGWSVSLLTDSDRKQGSGITEILATMCQLWPLGILQTPSDCADLQPLN